MTDEAPVNFILASASPRRRQLLEQINQVPGLIIPADIDEAPQKDERPKRYAERMAYEKAQAISRKYPGNLVLAADTVVACGHRILPKAEDAVTARACLELLSGRKHRVISGIALALENGRILNKSVTSHVTFKRLSSEETATYIASKEWDGKAGGYAVQGLAAAYIRQLSGSYSNVVGLPLFEVAGWLQAHLDQNI